MRTVRRRVLFLGIVVACFAAGCVSRRLHECPDARTARRIAVRRTFRHPNGAVFARGWGMDSGWDYEVEQWDPTTRRDVPARRVGKWTYFYEDGSRRAVVTYEISCFIQCCAAGTCPQLDDYPVAFEVWYPSGRKLGKGSFYTVTHHVNTSCQSGDDTRVARMSPDSRFWREDGSAMTADEARGAGYLFKGW